MALDFGLQFVDREQAGYKIAEILASIADSLVLNFIEIDFQQRAKLPPGESLILCYFFLEAMYDMSTILLVEATKVNV
ncbi:hypothetical protein HW44_02335 [Nitrosococcus oceani]|nr:hypothetical protein HW44_02335 [Nitrosococcus oceani]